MIKMKTVFEVIYKNHKPVDIKTTFREGAEWIGEGKGTAYIKRDGTSCMIKDNVLYKRWDNKKGLELPKGAISCGVADKITGHNPMWILVDAKKPGDHIHSSVNIEGLVDGTYELIGEKVQGNPEKIVGHKLVNHLSEPIAVPRTFEGIKALLTGDNFNFEGVVFTKNDGSPLFKIRVKDFG